MHSFQKDKILGPYGWPIEFYLGFYEFLGKDLMRVVEEWAHHIHTPINSRFIAIIPKVDNLLSFDEFRPISLSNCLYIIISKIITRRIKEIISKKISREQFGFLEGRQIYEVVEVAQEGLHILKTMNLKGIVTKLNLSKSYDRVNWIYIRMILTHLGFGIYFIRWIMNCISSVSFSLLINGVASIFFHSKRGLHQGFPLSLLLFLLVVEGLIHC